MSTRYAVEKIVSHRINAITGVDEYLLQWEGTSMKQGECTWEAKSRLMEDGLSPELLAYDRAKSEGGLPLRDSKRAALLNKLIGRRAAPVAAPFNNSSTTSTTAAAAAAAAAAATATATAATNVEKWGNKDSWRHQHIHE